MDANVPEVIDFSKPEYTQFMEDILCPSFIFLGAGFSVQAGYKKWSDLINTVINEFWKARNIIKNGDKLTYGFCQSLPSLNFKEVMRYLYCLDNKFYYKVIKSVFKKDKECLDEGRTFIIQILKPLVADNNYRFMQTNIDDCFEKCCDIPSRDIRVNPACSIEAKLNYLHGKINRQNSWVFTQDEYFRTYEKVSSKTKKLLNSIFKQYTVLFLGYSLSDYEVVQSIARAKMESPKKSAPKNHYVLMEYGQENADILKVKERNFEDINLKILRYNIENKGYDVFPKNLKSLVSAIVKRKGEERNVQ